MHLQDKQLSEPVKDLSFRQQRMLKFHLESRERLYKDSKIKFEEPKFFKKCNDSIVSKSEKLIFITRHWLTAECTHALILENDWLNRYSDDD